MILFIYDKNRFSLYHLMDTHIFVIHLFPLKQPTCHILNIILVYVIISDTIQSYFVLRYSNSSLNTKVLVTFSRLFKGKFILRSLGVSHPAALMELNICKITHCMHCSDSPYGEFITSLHIQYKPDYIWLSLKLSNVTFGRHQVQLYILLYYLFSKGVYEKSKIFLWFACYLSLPLSFTLNLLCDLAKRKSIHFYFLDIFSHFNEKVRNMIKLSHFKCYKVRI